MGQYETHDGVPTSDVGDLRWPTRLSRVLKIPADDCLASLLTATNRIVGCWAALQIASALAASFFCRFANGFT
jgi:hypothetical protein